MSKCRESKAHLMTRGAIARYRASQCFLSEPYLLHRSPSSDIAALHHQLPEGRMRKKKVNRRKRRDKASLNITVAPGCANLGRGRFHACDIPAKDIFEYYVCKYVMHNDA